VNPRIRSSIEAAAICKMADRGQISGGVVDGPLAFDTAVSQAAAKAQRITSPVTGQADILVAPDLETGTLLAKQLEYLAEAQAAGVVLGARVPIALVGGSDNLLSTRVACAVAMLLAHRKRGAPPVS
jgi:phosphate acetyltransferase/phosphate butyryltransferase